MLTIDEIKSEVLPLAKKYHIESVYLFGSIAKGTATENSDADFLVKFTAPVPSIFAVMGFKEELQKSLHTPVDVVTYPITRPDKLIIERTICVYET